jgi:hypothetical protein
MQAYSEFLCLHKNLDGGEEGGQGRKGNPGTGSLVKPVFARVAAGTVAVKLV